MAGYSLCSHVETFLSQRFYARLAGRCGVKPQLRSKRPTCLTSRRFPVISAMRSPTASRVHSAKGSLSCSGVLSVMRWRICRCWAAAIWVLPDLRPRFALASALRPPSRCSPSHPQTVQRCTSSRSAIFCWVCPALLSLMACRRISSCAAGLSLRASRRFISRITPHSPKCCLFIARVNKSCRSPGDLGDPGAGPMGRGRGSRSPPASPAPSASSAERHHPPLNSFRSFTSQRPCGRS